MGDRRQLLRDCEQRRKKIKMLRQKEKHSINGMFQKAFERGVFSEERKDEEEQPAKPQAVDDDVRGKVEYTPPPPLQRKIKLTPALAGDLLDELRDSYAEKSFQARVKKCAL